MRKSNLILLTACIMISAIVLANIEAIPSLQNHIINSQSDFLSTTGPPLQNVVWHRTYGGPERDSAKSLQHSNGDYILYGSTDQRALLLRTNSTGEYKWHKRFNTPWSYDYCHELVILEDGGFCLLIRQTGGPYPAPHFEDFMLIRTNSQGNQIWNQSYDLPTQSYTDQHFFHSLQLCSDGGYVVGAHLEVQNGWQPWLLRTDSNGEPLWNYTYLYTAGSPDYWSFKMIQCQDGGFAFTGTYSSNPFFLRVNASGGMSWVHTYPCQVEQVNHLVQCTDGSFAFVGYVYNSMVNATDIFLMKTNATGSLLWNRTLGTSGGDSAWRIIETDDLGFALAGSVNGTEWGQQSDLFFLKTDAEGNPEWNATVGGNAFDSGLSVIELANGDYIVSGFTESFGSGETDCWLLQIRQGYTPPYTPPPPPPPPSIPWYVIPFGISIASITVIFVVIIWMRQRSKHVS